MYNVLIMKTTQYITKVHKQHTSLMTSIPVHVQRQIELMKGDYLVWQVDENSDFVQICNFDARGNRYDRGDQDSS